MKRQNLFTPLAVLGLLLVLSGGILIAGRVQAQGPGPQGGDVPQAPLGTAFTYQGRLTDGGSPASGEYDFEFKLYNAASGGTLLGTVTVGDHTVTDGLFTVPLDFGDVFDGDALYLAIGVRPGSSTGAYTTLTPRQALTAAPYALSLRPGAYIHNEATSGDTAGVYLKSDSGYGLHVASAGDDGVQVVRAGNPSTTNLSSYKNGFEVAGAEGTGLYVGRADHHGVQVFSAGDNGVRVSLAGIIGVYANTAQASGEWGFYTPDQIYAGTALASGGPLMLVAQNGDSGNLETGDVVAVSGVGTAFAGSETPVPLVRRASAAAVGVVYRRCVAEKEVEESARDGKAERQTSIRTRSTEGPVAPGDYLLVVVLGPAQVQADAVSGGIRPGDLLTAGSDGQVMKAAPVKVGEVAFHPPGTIIGTAMGALDTSRGSGLIWMLVRPQ